MKTLLLVALGGGIGSISRYLISIALPNSNFPWGTFVVNITGAFLIGFFFSVLDRSNETLRLLLITGICGGFTTFSAFSLENLQLIQHQQWILALSYIFGSLILGLLATFLGIYIGNHCR